MAILGTAMRRGWLAATAAVAAGSVLLRLYLNLTTLNLEHSLAWRLVEFFSYFTNTTNILAAAVAAAALFSPGAGAGRPGVFAATSVYMLVTAATYQLLLRGDPHGLALVADTGLHLLAPALFLTAWLVFTPKGDLGWTAPLSWLAYPAAYIAWTLARGAAIHRYPYFFADADRLGYPRALLNGALFLILFYVLGLGAVAAERLRRAIATA